MNEQSPKIAVVHDHLGFQGGGERLVLILALELGADFVTAYAKKNTYPDYQKQLGEKLIVLSEKEVKTRVVRWWWLRRLFAKNRRLLSKYDILIASGQTATEVVAKYARPGATKIVYTHTPPRRVFDQYERSKQMYPWFLRPFYAMFAKHWKRKYLEAIKKFDVNIANSENIRERFRKFVGGEVSTVVWPPIETEKFKWKKDGDFWLSWGRVDEAKRIELIVESWSKMPDQRLIVASGGPLLEKVREKAKGFPNIQVVGWVSDSELAELVGTCQGVVYLPIDEDAGMTHLEGNAAGKPVLGVREGGLIESVREGETGILVRSNPEAWDVMQAVKKMTPEWCAGMRMNCVRHAKKFATDVFCQKMREMVLGNDPTKPVLGIDASRWEDPKFPGEERRTGVEMVSRGLILKLVPLAQKNGWRVRLYIPRMIPELPAEIQKVLPGKRMWTRNQLTKELAWSPPDVFFTPAYVIPDTAPENSFAIVHDVKWKTEPEKFSFWEKLKQEMAFRQNVRKSKKIITVSENSRREIVTAGGVRREKIVVAPLGHEVRRGLSREEKRDDFIFYIGRIEKKKSVDVLVKAFSKFSKNYPDWKLVLAGGWGHGGEEIRKLVTDLDLGKKVMMPGFVSENDKWALLTSAKIWCHPSASEGSCLPLFEAWDARTAAVVCDVPVLREVAGEKGALFFEKDDADDLAVKLGEMAEDGKLRKRLIKEGAEELSKRTWKKMAEKVMEVILKKEMRKTPSKRGVRV